MIQVDIKEGSNIRTYYLHPKETLSDLHGKVAQETGLKARDFQLVFCNKILDTFGEDLISEYFSQEEVAEVTFKANNLGGKMAPFTFSNL